LPVILAANESQCDIDAWAAFVSLAGFKCIKNLSMYSDQERNFRARASAESRAYNCRSNKKSFDSFRKRGGVCLIDNQAATAARDFTKAPFPPQMQGLPWRRLSTIGRP